MDILVLLLTTFPAETIRFEFAKSHHENMESSLRNGPVQRYFFFDNNAVLGTFLPAVQLHSKRCVLLQGCKASRNSFAFLRSLLASAEWSVACRTCFYNKLSKSVARSF